MPKFKVICSECNSENVSVVEDIDYDWDENPYVCGYYLQCNSCGAIDNEH